MNGWWLIVGLWASAIHTPPEVVSSAPEPCLEVDVSSLQLPPLAEWMLRRAEKIDEQNGRLRLRLWFEAPAGLGGALFRHFQALEAWFEGSGRPTAPVKNSFLKKADLEKIERLLPLKRFAERYGPLQVFHPAQAGQPLRAVGQNLGAFEPQLVLVFEPGRLDPVESYRVPDIAGFCGRRELLRFGQFLSLHHPGCRAVQIEARRLTTPTPAAQNENGSIVPNGNCKRFPLGNCLEAEFIVEGRLEGTNCPEGFSVKVDQLLRTTVLP
jgi:hypothetical protein